MSDAAPLRSVLLDNGLRLDFHDRSNRYFGDFHRVLLVVEGRLERTLIADAGVTEAADVVLFCRQLERMGVESARVDETRNEMIGTFLATAGKYLRHPEMPGRLREKYRDAKRRYRSARQWELDKS